MGLETSMGIQPLLADAVTAKAAYSQFGKLTGNEEVVQVTALFSNMARAGWRDRGKL
jgi:hypothetical protein